MKSSIIRTALNEIFAMTQFDPSTISPDDHLHKDLGLTHDQVKSLLHSTARQLGLNTPPVETPETPRQLVDLLSKFSSEEKAA